MEERPPGGTAPRRDIMLVFPFICHTSVPSLAPSSGIKIVKLRQII